jgi:hypothetical protein
VALSSLPRLNSVSGNKNEKRKRLKEVDTPLEDRDAVNKKWVEDNYTPLP